jgi:predicted ATPase
LEDAHWIDPTTETLIGELMAGIAKSDGRPKAEVDVARHRSQKAPILRSGDYIKPGWLGVYLLQSPKALPFLAS